MWTDKEDKELQKLRGDGKTIKECSLILQKEYFVVKHRAQRLKKGVINLFHWTKDEDNYLISAYPECPIETIMDKLSKSKSSIINRARKLKLFRSARYYKSGIRVTNWTKNEIDKLVKFYPTEGAEYCAKLLGRELNAVYTRANTLGLHKAINGLMLKYRKDGVCKCPICDNEKPFTEEFFQKSRKNKLSKEGDVLYRTKCKECLKKEWKAKRNDPKRYISSLRSQIFKRHSRYDDFDSLCSMEELFTLYEYQKGKCAISGIKMTTDTSNGRCLSNISIDRIKNNKGYSIDNIQLVCLWANQAKSTLTMDVFMDYCKKTVNYEKRIEG
jgi:hypothetical protein